VLTASNQESELDAKSALSMLWPHLRYLSLGLFLAWIYLLIDYGAWRSDSDLDGLAMTIGSSWFFSISVILLMLCALFYSRVERMLDSAIMLWIIVVSSLLGITCLIVGGPLILPDAIPSFMRDLLFPLGNAFCSVAAVLITLQCARRYCVLEPNRILFYALLSELVVFLVFTVVVTYSDMRIVNHGPSLSGVLALCILPTIAWLFLSLPEKNLEIRRREETRLRPGQSKSIGVSTNRYYDMLSMWRLFLMILILTVAASIIRNCFAASQLTSDYQTDAQLTMLLRAAFSVVLLLCSITIIKHVRLEKFYVLTAAGIAFSLVFASLWGIDATAFGALSNSLFFLLDLMIWCVLVLITQAKRYPAVLVFGIGRGIVSVGLLIGYLLGSNADVAYMLASNNLFAIILILAVVICITIVFNEKQFDRLLIDTNADKLDLRTLAAAASIDIRPITHKIGLWDKACKTVGERAALSEREQEILRQLADNRTPSDMASYLCISIGTVRTHTRNVYTKLNVHSRDELIALVRDEHSSL
jgi:DNA-binding CsgD family transcriptional regulator